jgi:hypothetical protein
MVKTNKEGLTYVAEFKGGQAIHKVGTIIKKMNVYVYFFFIITVTTLWIAWPSY